MLSHNYPPKVKKRRSSVVDSNIRSRAIEDESQGVFDDSRLVRRGDEVKKYLKDGKRHGSAPHILLGQKNKPQLYSENELYKLKTIKRPSFCNKERLKGDERKDDIKKLFGDALFFGRDEQLTDIFESLIENRFAIITGEAWLGKSWLSFAYSASYGTFSCLYANKYYFFIENDRAGDEKKIQKIIKIMSRSDRSLFIFDNAHPDSMVPILNLIKELQQKEKFHHCIITSIHDQGWEELYSQYIYPLDMNDESQKIIRINLRNKIVKDYPSQKRCEPSLFNFFRQPQHVRLQRIKGKLDLREIDLQQIEWPTFENAIFSHVDFSGTKFNGTNLTKVDFSYSVLKNVTFGHCVLKKTIFNSADLQDADITDAQKLNYKQLVSATWTIINVNSDDKKNNETLTKAIFKKKKQLLEDIMKHLSGVSESASKLKKLDHLSLTDLNNYCQTLKEAVRYS